MKNSLIKNKHLSQQIKKKYRNQKKQRLADYGHKREYEITEPCLYRKKKMEINNRNVINNYQTDNLNKTYCLQNNDHRGISNIEHENSVRICDTTHNIGMMIDKKLTQKLLDEYEIV